MNRRGRLVWAALLLTAAMGLGCMGLPAGASSIDGAAPHTAGAAALGAACKPCAIASACCDAVGGGPECVFSATACAASSDPARAAYVNGCQNFVKSVVVAWKQQPPAECL